MPDSVRVLRSGLAHPPTGRSESSAAVGHHPCDFEWGDSRNSMRGSILGMGFGTGFWVALFGLISLLKH